MITGIIGKDVLEAMLPLEGRANFGQSEVGTVGMGEAVGTAGHIPISAPLPPITDEGLVPKPQGQVSEAAKAETTSHICHGCFHGRALQQL